MQSTFPQIKENDEFTYKSLEIVVLIAFGIACRVL